MRTGRCFVVGAGDVTPRGLVLRPDDMLIAADGGLDALTPLDLRPHCLVGDMDSLQSRKGEIRSTHEQYFQDFSSIFSFL